MRNMGENAGKFKKKQLKSNLSRKNTFRMELIHLANQWKFSLPEMGLNITLVSLIA